jgi:predicted RNase H-like HicB family nuclease
MNAPQRFTAFIEREDIGYVALCPELDIASQGESIEESRANLFEALTLFFETASPSEIARRSHYDVFVTHVALETTTITVPVPLHDSLRRGTLASIVRQSELPRSFFETE